MPKKFDFISPGVSLNEVDQSVITIPTEDDGILLIGYAPQGPANVPVKVKNLNDFYATFGYPISGKGSNSSDVWRDGNQQVTTYGMYAAQAWLASGVSPVTFIRLLGSDATTQATGYVKAGWNTDHGASLTAASVAAAYGLFVMPSGAAGETLSGKLAAVIYASGSSLALSGTIAGTSDATAATNTLYRSDSSSGIANTYTLRLSNSSGAEDLTFHLDRTQQDGYIRNVLNCNPQKIINMNYGSTKNYFLGETFDVAQADIVNVSGSNGEQYAMLMPLAAGASKKWGDHKKEATVSKTGWFINKNPSPKSGYSSFNVQEVPTQATLVDAIDTTGAANTHAFTITVPIAAGGDGVAHKIELLANDVAVDSMASSTNWGIAVSTHDDDDKVRDAIIKAINGTSGASIGYSDGGVLSVLAAGTLGITAAAGSTSTKITLTMDNAGTDGQVAVLTRDEGFETAKLVLTAFTGGDITASAAEKIFRLCSLHEGEWFQQNYGVRIENLRIGTTANPDSTFSVVIVDREGTEAERFDLCNLNESSIDYVAKRIGDQYQTYNTTLDKFVVSGEYLNNSGYVRVEMYSSFDRSDTRALPFGVYGPKKPNTMKVTQKSTHSGVNVLGILAEDETWDQGHAGLVTYFAHLGVDVTLNLEFPEIALTDNKTSTIGNYGVNFAFGARHMLDDDNHGKNILWYSPDYKDLVRALPGGLDMHGDTSSTYLKQSWIFSLDEVVQDSNDTSKYYFEKSSHTDGTSYTAINGSDALLTEGVKKFNAPFFGGSDGLDIRYVDPFSITNGLASIQSATKHYAYYSVKRALDIVKDPDLINFDIIAMPGLLNSALALDLIRVAEERGDALAIIDLDGSYRKSYENSGTEVLGDHKQAIANAKDRDYNTSYAATYYPPVRISDNGGSNDITVVHPSVAAIGAIGYSEANSDGPWFAPAGFNRGGISILGGNSGPHVSATLEHLTKKNRDDLYENNINPIARFPAVGEIVIFGQKTLQQTASALDRINVRRLMIYLKKKIGRIADTILFDQNINNTWNRFKSQADAVLGDVRSRFGITEYKLVLDESTTTADLVDRNIMYAKVFVKPARAIEFIVIDFVITKSGIEL